MNMVDRRPCVPTCTLSRWLALLSAAWCVTAPLLVQAQGTERPEAGKHLQAAPEQLRNKQFKDALTRMREVDGTAKTIVPESILGERQNRVGDALAKQADESQSNLGARSNQSLARFYQGGNVQVALGSSQAMTDSNVRRGALTFMRCAFSICVIGDQ